MLSFHKLETYFERKQSIFFQVCWLLIYSYLLLKRETTERQIEYLLTNVLIKFINH